MKQNEDGFYSVEDCVEALTKPPMQEVTPISPRLDMRRTYSRRIYQALKRTPHVAHIPCWTHLNKYSADIYCSYTAKSALDCEDFDALITALETINQLNK